MEYTIPLGAIGAIMNNFVAKHNYNRASTHKTAKDYSRKGLIIEYDEEPPIYY